MSRLNSWAWSSSTPSTEESARKSSSTLTSAGIRVDSHGWPVVEVQRARWPKTMCFRCTEKVAVTWLPLQQLGLKWDQYLPEPDYSLMALCNECFKIARSEEGRIMGYRTVKGKTRQYVKEELLGEDILY